MSLWKGRYSRQPHGYWNHHLILEVGLKSGSFLLMMSDFADQYGTDGRLKDRQVGTLGGLLGGQKARRLALERLAGVHLIARLPDDSGWVIVDWLDGHKTAAQLEKLVEDRRSAGRKGGQRRAANQASGQANAKQTPEQELEQGLKQTPSSLPNPGQVRSGQVRSPPPPTPSSEPLTTAETEADDLAVVALVVAVADAFVQELGYLDEPAGPDIQRYVARALNRGWVDDDVIDVAAEAAGRPDVGDVRAYAVNGGLKRLANTDPPPERAERQAGPEIDLDFSDLTGLPADPEAEIAQRYEAEESQA